MLKHVLISSCSCRPVMPVEIVQVPIVPVDFFECNPAIDVPSSKNQNSQLADSCKSCESTEKSKL
jgi:hypothetical protein